ncbi:glucose-6-phosphate isomerase [Microbacterium paludicola]|uniref:glucose-6-phosphate isomerase n=1 Tax=Microbacterium paludicola TaxID=300019 RepID=A0A4Y9FVQ9_9MICO|nr:glucose-6-phosphate isomerase family protein [Microbacterium paludicola]MBF0815950.1 glucose-6-phosphate isomerase [Microbacterium paludicola]TFU33418.1 glucose-6-phosphate isomerase [Microbacterium paludicola]
MRTEDIYGAPVRLAPDAEGTLEGSDGRYEKRLSDLAGLYRDDAAYARALEADQGEPVYWVESSTPSQVAGALTIGVSCLRPGTIGNEFAMTRGHIHRTVGAAELYYGLSGRGVMLMDALDGDSRAVEITPGVAVHVPGGWIHRSVNVGDELFTTLFCYATDAGQDYDVIAHAGGMRSLIVRGAGGAWAQVPNPDHRGYRSGETDE